MAGGPWIEAQQVSHSGSVWLTDPAAAVASGGKAFVNDGTTWVECPAYINDGISWIECLLEINDGTSWNKSL